MEGLERLVKPDVVSVPEETSASEEKKQRVGRGPGSSF